MTLLWSSSLLKSYVQSCLEEDDSAKCLTFQPFPKRQILDSSKAKE